MRPKRRDDLDDRRFDGVRVGHIRRDGDRVTALPGDDGGGLLGRLAARDRCRRP